MNGIKDKYDRFIDYLRISVTDRCNLRCIYCMPAEGIKPIANKCILSFEEIIRVARISASLGVRKIRITGGEPLVRKDLPWLIESLSQINGMEDISLTTNGLLLSRYARILAFAGLNRINVSLDSLHPDRYKAITRGGDLEAVWAGIREAEKCSLWPIKINMVPIRGVNDDEIEEFARLTLRTPYQVRFIELMPTGRIDHWNRDKLIPTDEIMERVSAISQLIPVKTRRSGPARYFRFQNAVGALGFISPITHHFCDSCNRLRITADGKLRPCLFSDAEIDLKSAMAEGASDRKIERLLRISVKIKPERHSLNSESRIGNFKPMSMIGG